VIEPSSTTAADGRIKSAPSQVNLIGLSQRRRCRSTAALGSDLLLLLVPARGLPAGTMPAHASILQGAHTEAREIQRAGDEISTAGTRPVGCASGGPTL
jgi:hypothetical protein